MTNALFRAGEPVPRLHRLQTLRKYTIGATDGDVVGVDTIYFDDVSWTVRYLVVDTGTWLPGRKVLISPRSIERVDVERDRVVTNLTRERVENSPDIDTKKPVSRQQESRYYNYYGYPDYWTGPYRWGLWADPFVLPPYPPGPTAEGLPPAVAQELAAREHADDDPHLRSAAAVTGHGIQATDGSLGHVEDFLLEEPSWAIRYLIVDPTNWWPGPHVVISTEWVAGVDDDRILCGGDGAVVGIGAGLARASHAPGVLAALVEDVQSIAPRICDPAPPQVAWTGRCGASSARRGRRARDKIAVRVPGGEWSASSGGASKRSAAMCCGAVWVIPASPRAVIRSATASGVPIRWPCRTCSSG